MLLRLVHDFRRALDLSLVLDSQGIPHELRSLEGDGEEWALAVADDDAARAELALRAFERENVPAGGVAQSEEGGAGPGLVFFFAILAAFVASGPARRGPWASLGAADAARVLAGEWWRTVTALTLHADTAHAAGNAVVGGLFVGLLARRFGAALSAWLTLASGVLGTALAAVLARRDFISLGASTAVFGALGALTAARARDPARRREAWVYLGAGVALLGFLGTAERADLLGHLGGFVWGGLLAAPLARARRFSGPVDAAVGAAALLVPALAWLRAVR